MANLEEALAPAVAGQAGQAGVAAHRPTGSTRTVVPVAEHNKKTIFLCLAPPFEPHEQRMVGCTRMVDQLDLVAVSLEEESPNSAHLTGKHLVEKKNCFGQTDLEGAKHQKIVAEQH